MSQKGLAVGGYLIYSKYSNNRTKTVTVPQQITQPSPTTDETANWKTYTNTDFGGEFKYPRGLILKDYPNQRLAGRQVLISQNSLPDDFNIAAKSAMINFGSQELSNGSEQLVQGNEVIVIGGEQGKLQSIKDPETGNVNLQASLIHGNKVFFFIAKDQYRDDFNQILSTFKFTQ